LALAPHRSPADKPTLYVRLVIVDRKPTKVECTGRSTFKVRDDLRQTLQMMWDSKARCHVRHIHGELENVYTAEVEKVKGALNDFCTRAEMAIEFSELKLGRLI
jgi:hypothetical protein